MEVNSYVLKWVKSHAQGVFAQRKETVDCNPLSSNIEKKWHMKTLKSQVVKLVIFSCS